MSKEIDCYSFSGTGDLPKVNLPKGWMALTHKSGGIVYIHSETRVVTWSRPYEINKTTSVRVISIYYLLLLFYRLEGLIMLSLIHI